MFDETYCCYPFLFYVQPSNIGQWLKQVNKFVDPKAGLRLLMGHGASGQGIAHGSVWDFRNELQDDDAADLSRYGILTTDGAMTGNVEKVIGKQFMRFSLIVIDEFHTHPNADAGCGFQLKSMARAATVLISGTPYGSAEETITNWFPRLLFADLARGTGMEFTEDQQRTAAETRKKIIEAGKVYAAARKQFEKALDSGKGVEEAESELDAANTVVTRRLGKWMIRRLKTGKWYDGRISQADPPKEIIIEASLSSEARLRVTGQLASDQDNAPLSKNMLMESTRLARQLNMFPGLVDYMKQRPQGGNQRGPFTMHDLKKLCWSGDDFPQSPFYKNIRILQSPLAADG